MTEPVERGRSVIYADAAIRDLDDIADWNERTYGRSHAVRYINH